MVLDSTYQQPHPALAQLVDQPKLPGARISPDYRWICFLHRPGQDNIADLADQELKLGGIRFNPVRHTPTQSSLTYDQITMRDLHSEESWTVEGIPVGKIHAPSWSPDSQSLVFLLEDDDGLRLWILRAGERRATQLCSHRVSGILAGALFRWEASGRSLLTRLVMEHSVPVQSRVPRGPITRQTTGEKAPVRTYQDLLVDENDAELFHHYAVTQLARVDCSGKVTKLSQPAPTIYYESSPDGRYILHRVLEQPYSYLVPYYRFGGSYRLLDRDGRELQTLESYPSTEELPKGFDSVRTGRREIQWRDDLEATLVWVEAQDGGDMKTEVPFHDKVLTWAAPFTGEPVSLLDIEMRFESFDWGHDHLALFTEWRFNDRKIRTWSFDPSNPEAEAKLFDDRSYNDQYRDPGSPLHALGPLGTRVLATINSGRDLLLTGQGASPEGNIPFLDQWNSETSQKMRLWQSQAPHYERVVGLLDQTGQKVVTLRESNDEPPNFFIRDLVNDTLVPLTHQTHPTPYFRGLKKELITYQRKDGVDLSAQLYLPPDYQGGPLPVVMWAYPLEYKDPTVAGQVTSSPYEFHRVSYWGPIPFLAKGYAVLDDPKMPIIGEGDQLPNDTFRQQLIDSAEAAIEALVERGVCDPERVAIGGHSYGAFMVANLLAHSDLFKTGIARSGAYNRTLTPFGFQGEERDFWESQAVYSEMSPFFHVDKIKRPLLLIHGSEDDNPGTFPMQSERLFAAIKGLGGLARLVMLPKESHSYRARESLLHMLWEQETWLEKHL